jgi:hypothetical protein
LWTGLIALQSTDLNPLGSLFKTPGVKSIEGRYTAGGGAPNHLPGVASPLGSKEKAAGNVHKEQGVGTDKFKDEIAGQKEAVSHVLCFPNENVYSYGQTPREVCTDICNQPGAINKAWQSAQYGQEKGK